MILILDDHPVARQGIESIIKMYRTEEQVLQAGNVSEAINHIRHSEIEMALLDVNLGKESGFDFIEFLKKEKIKIKLYILTSSIRSSDFLYARKIGVDAYVLKTAYIDEIIYGLKVVERGGKFYSASIIERMNQSKEDENQLKELTKRELDVLVLLSQGYSNEKISKSLFISEGTTKKYITSILCKLGLKNRVEVALFASKNSFIIKTAFNMSVKEDLRKVAKS